MRRHCFLSLSLISVLLGCGGGSSGGSRAQTLSVVRQVLTEEIEGPMQYKPNPANPTVAYVLERQGRVRALVSDVLQTTPVLDIRSSVSTGGEGGLLGMALPNDIATNRWIYLYFVADAPLRTRVVRYALSPDGLTANPTGESIIEIEQPFTNHKGGSINFGTDGRLLLALGDGGDGNDPGNRAQDPTTLLGKFVRIDLNGDDFPADPDNNYRVPGDNPFAGATGARGEILSVGLRNPFRWSLDSTTGAWIIADVGQSAFEEVNFVQAAHSGRNFGWRQREGRHETGNGGPASSAPLADPFLEYGRGDGASVIGGFRYTESTIEPLQNRYLFGDFVSNRLWAIPIDRNSSGEAIQTSLARATRIDVDGGWNGIVSIDRDIDGETVVTELGAGRVSRIVPVPTPVP